MSFINISNYRANDAGSGYRAGAGRPGAANRRYEVKYNGKAGIETLIRRQIDNFFGGLFRGMGVAVGFTLLAAILIVLMSYIVQWNLPYVSEFIAKVLTMVEYNMQRM